LSQNEIWYTTGKQPTTGPVEHHGLNHEKPDLRWKRQL
jgi:hypothetical protein